MLTTIILMSLLTWLAITIFAISGLLLLNMVKMEGSWEKQYVPVPLSRFGSGCLNAFGWYLQRECTVPVTSVADICRWLKTCDYTHDPHLFQRNDFWQHPQDFEQARQGDCEDHALWAWRRLIELGLEADFVVGYAGLERHAWVTFKYQGKEYLLETTLKYDKMVYLLETTQARYQPDIGVDHRLRTYQYSRQTALSYLFGKVGAWTGPARRGLVPVERGEQDAARGFTEYS